MDTFDLNEHSFSNNSDTDDLSECSNNSNTDEEIDELFTKYDSIEDHEELGVQDFNSTDGDSIDEILCEEQEREQDECIEYKETVEIKSDDTVKQSVNLTNKMVKAILKPVYTDVTNMFSDGEIILLDGDSIILDIIGDPNYEITCGGQLLHFIYLFERKMQLFIQKGGKFEIVFFNIWRHCWSNNNIILMARNVLVNHTKYNTSFNVIEFDNFWDVNFIEFITTKKICFLLMNLDMQEVYKLHFPEKELSIQDLVYNAHILYCLLVLHLAIVDINDFVVKASTLEAFHFSLPFNLKCETFKSILKQVINTIDKEIKLICFPVEILKFPFTYLDNFFLRHTVSVYAAAHILCDDTYPNENWVQAFLLYSAILEVLPLKYRGCSAIEGAHKYNQFVDHLFQAMLCVMKEIHNAAACSYDFRDIPDLWHGNLFTHVVKYVEGNEEISVTRNTSEAYDIIFKKVVEIVGRPLKKLNLIKKDAIHLKNNTASEHYCNAKTIAASHKKIIPITCKLVIEFCGDIMTDMIRDEIDNIIIKYNSAFEENHHWHNHKKLSDNFNNKIYLNEKERRLNQLFSRFMNIYGASIEGRSSVSKVITSVKEKHPKKEKKAAKEKHPKKESQKAKQIKEKNMEVKLEATKDHDRSLFKDFVKKLKILEAKEMYEIALNECNLFENKQKTDCVLQSALLIKLKILWKFWQKECYSNKGIDRNITYAKEIFLLIKRILEMSDKYEIQIKDQKNISECLWKMGFGEVANLWSLPEYAICLKDSVFSFEISWADFQLLYLGSEMERDIEGEPDKRVEGFIPDKWQKKLFDSIDNNQSILVVAPTSSGKTYASYYCMEKVLKECDDGIVVYVSPTKALVNQVAATVYARFKGKTMPPGKSVYSIFTRDYHHNNILTSQIVVTVPECLELLLLSPRRHDWVQKLRYVICDEIHCLAGQAGGLSWECALLLIKCPFIALSATVGSPESFKKWLQEMQNFKHEMFCKTVGCKSPCDSYKVNLITCSYRHSDLKKYVYCDNGKFEHIHPYAYLDCKNMSEIPKHILLSSEEAHQLFNAMIKVNSHDSELQKLDPQQFFHSCTKGFISQKSFRNYESELKKVFENWLTIESLNVKLVLQQLKNPHALPINESVYQLTQFNKFLQKMVEENMLPAIVFSYNRNVVNQLFQRTTKYFETIDLKNEQIKSKKREARSNMLENLSDDEMNTCKTINSPRNIENGKKNFKKFKSREKFGKSLSLLDSSYTGVKKMGFADANVVKFIENRLCRYGRSQTTQILAEGLRLGIGMHYGGMNAVERNSVEMLFRMKFLNLVFATGTLALGVHMPCKTVVILGDSTYLNPLEYQQMSGRAGRRGFDNVGNVVFMALNERKMIKLLTGKVSKMIGNFPLSVTMVLKLLLMINDITSNNMKDIEAAEDAIKRALTFLNCCMIYQNNPELKYQMRHYFCISVQLLLHQGLLDDMGQPLQFSGIITHLSYHEPGNIAFIYLLRCGVLKRLFNEKNITREMEQDLIIILSYLFSKLPLHPTQTCRTFNNSIVILPPLPSEIHEALEEYNKEVVSIFDNYFINVAKHCQNELGDDKNLPLSGIECGSKIKFEQNPEETDTLETFFIQNSKLVEICSSFAALSGHIDNNLYSSENLISNIRHQVFTDVKIMPIVELDCSYNSYALDFYNHGIFKAIIADNGLKSGDDYKLLQDFSLMLKALNTELTQILSMDSSLPEVILLKENKAFLMILDRVTCQFDEKFYKSYGMRPKA